MADRKIVREADGHWLVFTQLDSFVSGYERREDALARVTTSLEQTGGGSYVVVDDRGAVLEEGEVSREPDASAA